MAIDAKFTADFSDFDREVEGAARQLDLFEKESVSTGAALERLSSTTKKSGGDVQSLRQAYSQFDDVLKAAGINLGPLIRGLEDLATAASKSAAQLGLLGKLGIAAAVGKITYDITSSISSFVGLDKAIGDNVAKWLGWGDVAGQEAAAVADALALASQRAGKSITDYNEAIRINAEWQKARTKATKEDLKAQEEWTKANEAVQIAAQNHSKVLATLNPQVVEAAKFALEHGVSQKDVATAYKLTASEIAAINVSMDQHKEKLKEIEAWNKLVAESMKAHWDGVGKVVDQVLGVEALQKATTWVDAIEAMGGSVANLRNNELEQLKAVMLEGIDALARMGQLTSEQSSHFANLAAQADVALNALKPLKTEVFDLSKAMWEYVRSLDAETAATQKAAQAERDKSAAKSEAAAADAKRKQGDWTAAFGGMQMPQGVITDKSGVARDMFGRPVPISPNLNLPRVTPGYHPAGSNINVNVHGMVISTYQQLADAIGNAMVTNQRTGGNRLPV